MHPGLPSGWSAHEGLDGRWYWTAHGTVGTRQGTARDAAEAAKLAQEAAAQVDPRYGVHRPRPRA